MLNNIEALMTKIQNYFCPSAKVIEVKNQNSRSLPKANLLFEFGILNLFRI
jgi:hypothetical protein